MTTFDDDLNNFKSWLDTSYQGLRGKLAEIDKDIKETEDIIRESEAIKNRRERREQSRD